MLLSSGLFQACSIPFKYHKWICYYSIYQTFFMNQASYGEAYCRTNWANVVECAALNNHSTQNIHGGNCVPPNQTWFVQA
ncbi:hypothetical protein EV424DRAFT_487507 [Suillus variegatus]|nr:hypothetical protein EV424DRAFT_487507 [Suillus variegatus]